MQRFRTHRIGAAQGEIVLFKDFEDGGPMWTGDGLREVRHPVLFDEAFVAPPAVQLGLTLWDFSADTNIRADLVAEDVAATGFTIVFRTWGDTHVARVRVGWLALGALADDEDWEIG